MLFKPSISITDYDYKFRIKIERPLLMTRNHLYRKCNRFLKHFPNYNLYWEDDFTLIINIYFDNTGWDKDRKNSKTQITSSFDGERTYINFRWTDE